MRERAVTWKTKRLISKIQKADDEQLEAIIRCILRCYKKDDPDTEVIFLCLPRNDWKQRKMQLESMCNILLNEKMDSLG